jgi:DNA helicase-2/ATP-dependent DNA helicase PcrA
MRDVGWPDASRCFLRENYRSSGNILKAASALLEQGQSISTMSCIKPAHCSRLTVSYVVDPKRISTDLLIKHADGPPVTIQSFKTPKEQAQSIAKQIKHMLEDPDQILTADDFAILLRLNALSRNIEIALKTEGIPYKMAG